MKARRGRFLFGLRLGGGKVGRLARDNLRVDARSLQRRIDPAVRSIVRGTARESGTRV